MRQICLCTLQNARGTATGLLNVWYCKTVHQRFHASARTHTHKHTHGQTNEENKKELPIMRKTSAAFRVRVKASHSSLFTAPVRRKSELRDGSPHKKPDRTASVAFLPKGSHCLRSPKASGRSLVTGTAVSCLCDLLDLTGSYRRCFPSLQQAASIV